VGRAKYIEGLENRLGRMESLLRLSGLLSEDDVGKTDLGTLEKRLADRSMGNGGMSSKNSNRSSSVNPTAQGTGSQHSTPRVDSYSSPRTPVTSPDSQKETEAEVEGLSDMMCSLVTNNCGETRYIGTIPARYSYFPHPRELTMIKGPPLDYQYFRRKEFNGSTRKPAIPHFKI
jgi:hypothetical protein